MKAAKSVEWLLQLSFLVKGAIRNEKEWVDGRVNPQDFDSQLYVGDSKERVKEHSGGFRAGGVGG